MRYNLLLVGAIALVALSLGFPGAGGGPDEPDPASHSASLQVDLVEQLGIMRAVLRLDPDAQVVEVEMWSPATDLVFTQEGVDGLWIAEGPLDSEVDCYQANVRVALASTPQLVPTSPTVSEPVSKRRHSKKDKRADSDRRHSKKAGKADKARKHKKQKKHKKSKKGDPNDAAPALSYVLGGVVVELSASHCRASDDCVLSLQ